MSEEIKVGYGGYGPPPTKEQLLEHYATGDIRQYYQLDGCINDFGYDSITPSDEEGDCLTGTYSYELRRTDIPVRIHVLKDTPRKDAVRILKKMVDWYEQDTKIQSSGFIAFQLHDESQCKVYYKNIKLILLR